MLERGVFLIISVGGIIQQFTPIYKRENPVQTEASEKASSS